MREQILLNAFLKATEDMDIDPLELDRFLHEGFYEPMVNVKDNLDSLQIFLDNGLQGRKD
jgi:hypothetical protein